MKVVSTIILYVIVSWILLVILMLPVYFIRKRRNPSDKKNTMKSLFIREGGKGWCYGI
ncbi:MAG: hypothetical protein IJA10_08030 [Lachnospiraceae bacterium]|nr:hypothetical protein [Lachnospiraceae bacterium]